MCVRYRKKFTDGSRIHAEGYDTIRVNSSLQFFVSAYSTDKIYSLIGFGILNVQNGSQDIVLKNRYIKSFDRIGTGVVFLCF